MSDRQAIQTAGVVFGAIATALLLWAAYQPYGAWWVELLLVLAAMPFLLSAALCFYLGSGANPPQKPKESILSESGRSGEPVVTIIDDPLDWEKKEWA